MVQYSTINSYNRYYNPEIQSKIELLTLWVKVAVNCSNQILVQAMMC